MFSREQSFIVSIAFGFMMTVLIVAAIFMLNSCVSMVHTEESHTDHPNIRPYEMPHSPKSH